MIAPRVSPAETQHRPLPSLHMRAQMFIDEVGPPERTDCAACLPSVIT